ncbi:SRPBCC family protein [Microlunatus parietis]|uniref:Uncharacterized protein YndB with AHSA1/START domain n=1 Tax=Microlunatus parietis TaxID=682979 RepID=A0A7Y9IDC1_9ACTN|nr:SRPBCC family protein [Microlunatus parietis]NYE74496.1 uncharacterized protein YndB with AHSA1/START domain [Microlunatus parietis]
MTDLSLRARIAAHVSRVQRALTDSAEATTWLADHADLAPADRRYEFWGRSTPQGERGRQQLLAWHPERELAFRWRLDDVDTTVTLAFEPDVDHGTTLTLTQTDLPGMDELMAPTGRRDGRHSMHTFWPLAIANLAEHVEGRPLTPRADFGPDRKPEIRISIDIDDAADRVFDSLIQPKIIERWFGWEALVEPRVGGRIQLGVDGKIFEFEPGKRLSAADDEGSIVRWELAESDGHTHLTFVQSGYRNDELDNAAQHEAGWLAALAELKRMHELGDSWTPLTTEFGGESSAEGDVDDLPGDGEAGGRSR